MPLELIGDDVHLCCIQQEICASGFPASCSMLMSLFSSSSSLKGDGNSQILHVAGTPGSVHPRPRSEMKTILASVSANPLEISAAAGSLKILRCANVRSHLFVLMPHPELPQHNQLQLCGRPFVVHTTLTSTQRLLAVAIFAGMNLRLQRWRRMQGGLFLSTPC